MLFDPAPKRSRDDLFNFENELRQFVQSLTMDRLILVTGLRRYGKTSLILTGLSEAKARHIYVDCRLLPNNPTMRDLIGLMVNSGLGNGWFRDIIRSLDFIEVGVFGVRLRVRRVGEGLVRLIEELGESVLVLDEAQLLRGIKGFNIPRLLAYIYDHLKTRVVLSGSEVGLLYDFLGLHKPDSPLFGRAYREVRLRPLSEDKAIEFLRLGFRQVGIEPPEAIIHEAIKRLGGVVGWLTYFGYNYARGMRDLEAIIDDASRLIASEVNKMLDVYSVARARYVAVLNAVATLGKANWTSIKNIVEARLGKIPDTTLNNILRNLERVGVIAKTNKEYTITDPITREAIVRDYVK
ncbi:ATP-binding protein [Caldivirga sp.]|uniref:AAA family ATPase n=1 Tax=Caldivirga sp. TaxID=2080243 RepID=UPI0025B7DE66|nr:ATP-binding protein [Caldivirga sp.]